MLYAELILPVPLNQTFTYIVPVAMEAKVQVGMRCLVQFGKSHAYTGIIVALTPHQPETNYELKEISRLLDDSPIIRHPQYPLWQWISQYYLCAIGDVMKAALPSELKPEEGKEGIVREDFKAKTRTMVRITIPGLDEEESSANLPLEKAFESLKRSPQQQALFMKLLDMSHVLQKKESDPVAKEDLLRLSGTSTTIFNELKKKGLLETYEEEISRLDILPPGMRSDETQPPHPLSEMQKVAYRQICQSFNNHQVCLLHGVTSSGKTEIYIHLIEQVISQGRQVLLMVPEIALTTQLCQRLRRVFGRDMYVYHSKLSDTERVEIWKKMINGQGAKLIVGVRSSIFLPFQQLGLIIVDEEHEPSYKQQDPAPRYHGRDVAIVLAQRHAAKVLLGSATPSLESYYLAKNGKYGLVHLTERHAGVSMPKISLVSNLPGKQDAVEEAHMGVFTPTLLQSLGHTLTAGKQAILFQNRRGYAKQVECVQCGWTPRCPRCDVSLTYHKRYKNLQCHYCGYHMPLPYQCPQCGNDHLEDLGYGTERIEETLKRLLPLANPVRMDTDTTSTRKSYERIIEDFDKKKNNVLIGTQMVSKGLDFSEVQTVGILNADSLMNIPDFRSHERAFQLMEQVAGRAGRREGQEGEVLIQCSNPRHPLLRQVVEHNYLQMAEMQLADRQKFGYPPFTRLIIIYMKGRYEDKLYKMAQQYASYLRQTFGNRVLGPEAPVISRIKNMYIQQIMLKVEREASTQEVRRLLLQIQQKLQQDIQEFARIVFYYDVDPVG